MSSHRQGEKRLPAIVQEIADAIGLPAAMAIVAVAGGTRVYLPSRPRPNSWLVKTIGQDLANELGRKMTAFGASSRGRGCAVEIPLMRHVATAQKIATLHHDGLSAREIACRVGVTQRTVHRHVALIKAARAPTAAAR